MRQRLIRFILALLIMVAAPQMIKAQYVVKTGDTLYALAGKNFGDPNAWEKVYEKNPFLKEPGRRFVRDGKTVVVIRPGEVLEGLDAQGIVAEKVGMVKEIKKSETGDPIIVTETERIPTWWWIILLALLVMIVWLINRAMRHRHSANHWFDQLSYYQEEREEARQARREAEMELNRDPVASGPPMVPGGVSDETAAQHLQDAAARRWTDMTGREALARHFTIVDITRGRGYGIWTVEYSDASEAERRLTGEVVYRANVRYPDSDELVQIYMLQGCGNDLKYSNVRRYNPSDNFRFEADADVPVTQATTEPAAPAVAPAASPAAQTVVPASEPTTEDASGVRLTYIPANENGPHRIVMAGIDLSHAASVDMSEDSLVFRFTPRS